MLNSKAQLTVDVVAKVADGKITVANAAKLLNKSGRTIERYLKRYREVGIRFVVHGNTGNEPVNKTPNSLKQQVQSLIREKYYDVNLLHLRELLQANEHIEVKRETLRKWAHDIHHVKRAKSVEVEYKRRSRGPVAHVVVDATGVKIYGEGEWHSYKHGREKRRHWQKLHLAVDAVSHEVIAAQTSLDTVGDNEVLPHLLNPLRRKIKRVSADGAYDTKACHQLLQDKGVQAVVPPRKNAGYWENDHPRNKAVKALKAGRLADWKRNNDYHQRSLSETAMSRYKGLASPKLSLRRHNAQVAELLVGVKIMNKVIDLGMPVR